MATANTNTPASEQPPAAVQTIAPVRLPRVAIQFCTQVRIKAPNSKFLTYRHTNYHNAPVQMDAPSSICVYPPIYAVHVYLTSLMCPLLTPFNKQFAQELLSTFGGALGEVALQPATGGIFTVTIETADAASSTGTGAPKLLWDRKTEGGFPETKELKRRVRDVIEPGRDLGHVDRNYGKAAAAGATTTSKSEAVPAAAPTATPGAPTSANDADTSNTVVPVCEDCQ